VHRTHDSIIDYYCLENTSYHACTRTTSIGTEGSQDFIACYEDGLCPSAIKYITMDSAPTSWSLPFAGKCEATCPDGRYVYIDADNTFELCLECKFMQALM
jgi:hypothetical protein